MRKFITSTVFIVLFSMVSSQVIAGQYPECDQFKKDKEYPGQYIPGLYGLCNSYQDALANEDQEAMDDIFRTWEKKVGEDELPKLPGHPYPQEVTCPCWDVDDIADASALGIPQSCKETVDGTGNEFAIYSADINGYQFDVDSGFCFYLPPDSVGKLAFTSLEEEAACRADIYIVIETDFEGFVCDGGI